MLDEGVWAEIKVAGEHLRLFSEHNAQGVQTSVLRREREEMDRAFRAGRRHRGREREGRRIREGVPATRQSCGTAELPPLVWKKARSL